MKLQATYSEINDLMRMFRVNMRLSGVCDGCFALSYDPGTFLPTVTLRLRNPVVASSYIQFSYESSYSFMLAAANYLSVLPDIIELDTKNKTVAIFPFRMSVFNRLPKKITLGSFHIHPDSLNVGFHLA